MKKLIIIGAGMFGREVYAWSKQSLEFENEWEIKGFLDDRADSLQGFKYEAPIISTPDRYEAEKDDVFVCAIGEPSVKKRICETSIKKGWKFVTIVHSTVVFGENVKLGSGVILTPYVVVSCDATIGDFVSINLHAVVGHDVVIGKYSQINPHASIGGCAKIDEAVTISSNAAILPKAHVSEGAVVGAGSVVLRKVGANMTVFGVPARPLPVPVIIQGSVYTINDQ